jgi:two-component system response regulator FlrC
VDVRIVAATHRDLEREVKGERFRKDLYYRLAVITIDLPPLRERGEDILLLTNHYIDKFNAKYGKVVRGASDEAARNLLEYPWPGNVRELSHVIERAILWSQGERLDIEQLSLATSPNPKPADARAVPSAVQESIPPEGIDLAEWERSLIAQALHQTGGNESEAAKLLGIGRGAFRHRVKKLGLKA